MANPALYVSQYQEQINIALMESARLSFPEAPDVTLANIEAKRSEFIADDNEMSDIIVGVCDAQDFGGRLLNGLPLASA